MGKVFSFFAVFLWLFPRRCDTICCGSYQTAQPRKIGGPVIFVGLSMMCYREGKEERTSLGERQLRGRMGKSLYFLFQTASCFWKSSKEKNLCEA